MLNRLPEYLFWNKNIGLFRFYYFKFFPHRESPFHFVHPNSQTWSGKGFLKTPYRLHLAWSAKPPCPSSSSLGAVLESIAVWTGQISLGDYGVPAEAVLFWLGQFQSWRRFISAVFGTYWCCVLCGVHHMMYRHTQAFAFLMILAPPWLFFLQIHVWLSKWMHEPPVSLCSLACPLLTSRQNSLTGGWRITPGCWPGGLSMASF